LGKTYEVVYIENIFNKFVSVLFSMREQNML